MDTYGGFVTDLAVVRTADIDDRGGHLNGFDIGAASILDEEGYVVYHMISGERKSWQVARTGNSVYVILGEVTATRDEHAEESELNRVRHDVYLAVVRDFELNEEINGEGW